MVEIRQTIDVLVDQVPSFQPGAEEQKAAMRADERLLSICDTIDTQLKSFLLEPDQLVRELRERIRSEPLASRFRPTMTDRARDIIRSTHMSPEEFPEGEVSLKRAELFEQLDGPRSLRHFTLGQIGQATQIAVSEMRDLLINFEFSKTEM